MTSSPTGRGPVLILGGSGFVGLNLAERLLSEGRAVVVFDRAPPPPAAAAAFAALPGRLEVVTGDVRDPADLARAVTPGLDAVVLGAAITAGPAREASDPEAILAVNLLAQTAVLRRARDAGVRRVVNLSSGAAYGRNAMRDGMLREDDPGDPESLYAITKLTSERVLARLAALWKMDALSVRLSAVFGPWERETGVRDTLSPHAQILAHAMAGRPALLSRPGLRDWVYAPDVADAVARILDAPTLGHGLYNVTTPERSTALAWGERVAAGWPGFACRLAAPGEAATVDLHAGRDRAPLDGGRLTADLGWSAGHDLASSADHLARWWRGDAPADTVRR